MQNAGYALQYTVYPKKYAHGFVVLCFVMVMQSFIMNSHEVFIHIHQGCFAGTGAIVRLPQCQWSKPGGYGTISQCITTTKYSKAKTVCIFLGIYCTYGFPCVCWYLIARNIHRRTKWHHCAVGNIVLYNSASKKQHMCHKLRPVPQMGYNESDGSRICILLYSAIIKQA